MSLSQSSQSTPPSQSALGLDAEIALGKQGSDLVLYLLVGFFGFLCIVLGVGGWSDYTRMLEEQDTDIRRTTDAFVAQTSLVARASIGVNQLFILEQKETLDALLQAPQQDDLVEQVRTTISASFFNVTGFFILDAAANLVVQSDGFLDSREAPLLRAEVIRQGHQSGVFAGYYGDQGGFYVSTPWLQDGVVQGYLVVRRPYAAFSQFIYGGEFRGYELLLIERDTGHIFIRRQQLYQVDAVNQTLTAGELNVVAYSRPIDMLPWDVYAVIDSDYYSSVLWKVFSPLVAVLLLYLAISVALLLYIRRNQTKQQLLTRQSLSLQQRAHAVLDTMPDLLLLLDSTLTPQYANQALLDFFGDVFAQQRQPPLDALFDADIARQVTADTNNLFAGDASTATREFTLVRQGESFCFEARCVPLQQGQHTDAVIWLLRDRSEERRAERIMRESQQQYEYIYNSAGVALWVVDLEHARHIFELAQQRDSLPPDDADMALDMAWLKGFKLVAVNDTAVELFAAPNKQALIDYVNHVIAEDGFRIDLMLLNAVEKGERRVDFEVYFPAMNQQRLYLWVNITLPAAESSFKRVLISLMDMTAHKRAEQQLQQQEQFWSSVLQAVPDLVYVNDLTDKENVYQNRPFGALFGYDADDIKRMGESHWRKLVHPDEADAVKQHVRQLSQLEQGQVEENLFRILHKDGTWHWGYFREALFEHDTAGRVKRYIGTVRDVTDDVRAKHYIAEREQHFRLITESASDIIWTTDPKLNLTYVSPAIEVVLGFTPDEVISSNLWGFVPVTEQQKALAKAKIDIEEARARARQTGESKHLWLRGDDFNAVRKDGTPVILELNYTVLTSRDGEFMGVMGNLRDITYRRKMEREQRLAAGVFESSTEAIIIVDHRGRVMKANQAFASITGHAVDAISGKALMDFVSDQHDSAFYHGILKVVREQGHWQGEVFNRRANGEVFPSLASINCIHDAAGQLSSYVVVFSDITEHKQTQETIHRLAYFDELTGLANRTLFFDRLQRQLDQAKRHEHCLVLLFLDLDRFKPVNDSMGHAAGDQLLREVATRLSACVREEDSVARMGGDEFTLLLGGLDNADTALTIASATADKVLAALTRPFQLRQREIYISASIGVAVYPVDGKTPSELLKNADTAMYHAKDAGRNHYQFYTDAMNTQALERLELEQGLHKALDNGEFELFYQPKMDALNQVTVGLEALLRWHHPELGYVPPDQFISIAEDTGLIIPIGEWVLHEACEQVVRWEHEGYFISRVAVNLSGRQFRETNLVDRVSEAIERSGIHPQQLELEITESLLIEDTERTLQTLLAIKALGVSIAIDDFGTGYSSLNYLKRFPLDTLKIDRSFIENVPGDKNDAQITSAIVAIAHSLHLGVIAEGVENTEQLEFLARLGCEEVQGFLFSKPLPADKVTRFLV